MAIIDEHAAEFEWRHWRVDPEMAGGIVEIEGQFIEERVQALKVKKLSPALREHPLVKLDRQLRGEE